MKKTLLVTLFGLSVASWGQSPVAHYPFNGNANDESGNGYNGTVVGATLTADRFGNPNSAYEFHGGEGTDSIALGYISELDNSVQYTISCWINQNVLDVEGGIWAFYDHNSTNINDDFYQLRTYTDGQLWGYQGGFAGLDYSTVISPGQWHHVVVVFDTTGSLNSDWYKMYVDGVLMNLSYQGGNMTQEDLPNTSSFFNIGSDNHTYYNGESWNGKLDDFYIYDVALSPTQVDSLYNLPNPSVGINEHQLLNVKIYPNPVQNEIKLSKTLHGSYQILGVDGKIVREASLNENIINVAELNSGIYIIRIITKEGQLTKRIIKA